MNIALSYRSRDELGQLADDIRHTAQVLYSYVTEIQSGLTALGNGRLNYSSDVEFRGDFVAVGNGLKEISRLLRNSLQQINSKARSRCHWERSRYQTVHRHWPREPLSRRAP
ncbi:MAG: hypothetical protein ACLTW9_02960 [Enterocloster sp.]